MPSDVPGLATLIPRLSQISPRRIVVEATGGLERALLRALVDAALPVIAVNPRPGRDVAQATGQLAKPDALDAAVLARFAAVIHPPERALPDPQTHVLALQRAGQSRLDHASARGQKRMEVHVRGLGAELARLEEDLSDMSEPSPVWREREDLLHSVPGMGPGMSRLVLAELPEWGRLHRKQVAALGGWPPSIATAAGCEAGGPSGADEPRGARRSLGRRGGRRAGIPSSGRATSVCVPPATHRTGASC